MTDTNSKSADRSYRPDIDGIRAIAILSVLAYHGGLPGFTGGYAGVDIFFVISGYLIGGHIFSELRAGQFSFLRFYARRARRILPAFFGVLVFSLVAALLLLSPAEAAEFGRSAFAATLSGSNLVFWHFSGYFASESELNPMLMTWSLGVEEQFYAIVPLCMLAVARVRQRLMLPAILLTCGVSLLLAWAELNLHRSLVFYMLPTRAWELGAGVALAVWEVEGRTLGRTWRLPRPALWLLNALGAVLMIAPMFLLRATSPFPGPSALPLVLGAVLVLALPQGPFNRKILSLSPLVFIGRISYSLYLWHWPLLAFARITCAGHLSLSLAAGIIAVAFACAVVSYYFIEQPFRRSTRPPGPLLVRYALAGAFGLALCAAVWLSGGLPQRYPEVARVESHAASLLKSDPCLVAHDTLPGSPSCYAAGDTRPRVAIWGDSHSAALAQGLRATAARQGYGLVQLGRNSCLPLVGAADYSPRDPAGASQCLSFNRQAFSVLAHDARIRFVVLTGAWADAFGGDAGESWLVTDASVHSTPASITQSSDLFIRSLSGTARALQEAGKQVIVMGDVPAFDFEPIVRARTLSIAPRRALANLLGASVQNTNDAPMRQPLLVRVSNDDLRRVQTQVPAVRLVDLLPVFCSDDSHCAYSGGQFLYYSDSDHLTVAGAEYALRRFSFPAAADGGEAFFEPPPPPAAHPAPMRSFPAPVAARL